MREVSAHARGAEGPGALLGLVRDAGVTTRAELAARTGLTRQAVAQRVEALLDAGLLVVGGEAASTGGRPAEILALNHQRGLVLVADLGATHAQIAISDLGGNLLEEAADDITIATGPEQLLGWVEDRFDELLARAGRNLHEVSAITVGVPGPVEFGAGRPVSPPIMPGWDGYPIAARLRERHPVPVFVDNDVNLMALGEQRRHWRECEHLVFIKVGTGVGCGIVLRGEVYRGSDGAAGDIGHIRVATANADEVICTCGNVGCLEALAGGGAMAERLQADGFATPNSRAVVELARAGEAAAVRLVRDSGRLIGEVLAASVNFFNPSVIVIGGDVVQAQEQLLAGVREVVYQRSLPLATRHLRIVRSQLADRAGVIGAAVMVIERVLSPAAIDTAIAAVAPGEKAFA
jgi:predicted NBD/HSP70 family sugar kinase